MNAIDRLVLYQQSKKEEVGGQNKFEAYIGLSIGYLSNMQKKGGSITSDVMIKVFDKFPLLNLDWLITGRGEMERSNSPTTDNSPIPSTQTISLEEENKTLQKKLIGLMEENMSLQKKVIALLEENNKLKEPDIDDNVDNLAFYEKMLEEKIEQLRRGKKKSNTA